MEEEEAEDKFTEEAHLDAQGFFTSLSTKTFKKTTTTVRILHLLAIQGSYILEGCDTMSVLYPRAQNSLYFLFSRSYNPRANFEELQEN